MSSKSIVELLTPLRTDGDFLGNQDECLVELAESRLGVTFPPSYREFLLIYGCGGIGGDEFYGVITDNFEDSGIPDAVWITLRERVSSGLPKQLVIVYTEYDGVYCAIDCRSNVAGQECPIVWWVPGLSTDSDRLAVIAENFYEFVAAKLIGNG